MPAMPVAPSTTTVPSIPAQQGFTLAGVIRAYSLLYSFTVGFCIEEQAVAQAAATGDDRYSFARRAERLNSRTHPLVRQAGPEITRGGRLGDGLFLDAEA